MTILVGTTSWTDPTLIESGRFYPPEVHTAEERLRYYASQFPIVEVDSSYYALPTARNSKLWVERTPAGFVFDVKAFRLLTGHQTPPEAFPKDLRDQLGPTDKKNPHHRDLPQEIREAAPEHAFADARSVSDRRRFCARRRDGCRAHTVGEFGKGYNLRPCPNRVGCPS